MGNKSVMEHWVSMHVWQADYYRLYLHPVRYDSGHQYLSHVHHNRAYRSGRGA